MKRKVLLSFVLGLFLMAELQARHRGHFGFRAHGLSRHPVPGAFGYSHPNRGFARFGFRTPGWGWRNYRPFYVPGIVFFGNSAFSQSREYIVVPEVESADSPSLYYQRAPTPAVKPDCRDPWAQRTNSSSLSQFMNRVFELQCENSSAGNANPVRSDAPTGGESDSIAGAEP